MFTDINKLEYFTIFGSVIGTIKIPKDMTIVKVDKFKYKSPQIFITEFNNYSELMKDLGYKYTVDGHRSLVRERLTEMKYPLDVIDEWISFIE